MKSFKIMQWTRRRFAGVMAGVVAGLAAGGAGLHKYRSSRLFFEESRSVPGASVRLHYEGGVLPEGVHVELSRCDGDARICLHKAEVSRTFSFVEFVVPYCHVEAESFEMVASLVDDRGRSLVESSHVEILTTPFYFGI